MKKAYFDFLARQETKAFLVGC